MKKQLMLVASICLMFAFQAEAQKSKATSLFNGKDLTGWTIYGTEKWFVEDGLLVCESGPDKGYGYLGTDESFKDFEVEVDFRQQANGNSGIFIRSSIEGTKVSGWQAEVAPPGHDTGGVYESYGRGWLIKPDPEKDKYLKMGKWNTMKVRVVGPTITTWLNGHEMITLTDDKIGEAEGSIALQIHDGGGIKVEWRKLKVTRL
ncbi:3-keto-disaccharide hydrolase [Arcticibacterium luteifluviistationis]